MPQYLESPADGDWDAVRRNVDQTDPRLAPPVPNARVFNSAAQTYTTAVAAVLTFDSEHWDVGDMHSTSTNTSRLTAPITGLYHIGCSLTWAANATGDRQHIFQVNGSMQITNLQIPAVAGGAVRTGIVMTTDWQLNAGDYVEVLAVQRSGGNLNTLAAPSFSPEFWMHRVSGFTNAGVG